VVVMQVLEDAFGNPKHFPDHGRFPGWKYVRC
jgi:hypothetical protein